ncbi:MAG TPA: DUF4232 domain-containing protein [Yinghuangia sp.]|uniref:DUF4232 domain-containing protein n=1 Tax=Yinghuangia sp. YIM S10712 TaxID=3436930 RepID=UPI002D1E27EC|nr:DUF4232 domain-containing protein [Yinghuangia sp.]
MDGPDHRTQGDAGTAAEHWLRARLTAHADQVAVPPPDIPRIDARLRGIRRRRAGWAACAASAVTAAAVVAAVALAGSGDAGDAANPLPAPPATTVPTETAPTTPPAPTGTAIAPDPTGTAVAPPPPGSPLPEATNTTGQAETTTAPGTSATPGATKPGGAATKGNSPTTSGSSGNGGSSAVSACTDRNVSIIASTEPHDSGRHILLTATNTGSTSCTLYFYPDVVFGDGSHDPVGPMESPAEVATIAPGKKAYSGLLLFKPGEQVDQVTSFAVNLRNSDNDGYTGNPIDVAIPASLGGALDIGPYPGTFFWNTDLAELNRYLYAR